MTSVKHSGRHVCSSNRASSIERCILTVPHCGIKDCPNTASKEYGKMRACALNRTGDNRCRSRASESCSTDGRLRLISKEHSERHACTSHRASSTESLSLAALRCGTEGCLLVSATSEEHNNARAHASTSTRGTRRHSRTKVSCGTDSRLCTTSTKHTAQHRFCTPPPSQSYSA